jgi:hypothetical protein
LLPGVRGCASRGFFSVAIAINLIPVYKNSLLTDVSS